jgi:hypothetical protein
MRHQVFPYSYFCIPLLKLVFFQNSRIVKVRIEFDEILKEVDGIMVARGA